MRQMAEGHRRHVRMHSLSCGERQHLCRDLRVDPELIIKSLKQLQARRELPRELRKNLVLLVGSWELRVGTRLAVVIAQVLISRKEPNSIVTHGTAEICSEVPILDSLVSAERLGTRDRQQDRLAGQA